MAQKRKSPFTEAYVLREVAKKLDYKLSDLEIDRSHLSDFTEHEVFKIESGNKEWHVARDADAMRDIAIAVVRQDLEQEPEIFVQSFIEQHLDEDRLRRELQSDTEDSNQDYYEEMDDRELLREGKRSGSVHVDENEDGEDVILDRDELIEELVQEKTETDLKYPLDYLEEIYGKEDAIKKAIEIAGIDVDAAAEDAVSQDGPEHFLSTYDGNSTETPSGFCFWRTN